MVRFIRIFFSCPEIVWIWNALLLYNYSYLFVWLSGKLSNNYNLFYIVVLLVYSLSFFDLIYFFTFHSLLLSLSLSSYFKVDCWFCRSMYIYFINHLIHNCLLFWNSSNLYRLNVFFSAVVTDRLLKDSLLIKIVILLFLFCLLYFLYRYLNHFHLF